MDALKPQRRRVGLIVAAVVLLAAGVGVYAVFHRPERPPPRPEPPADPRTTYTGPYENITPSVRYVADSRCAECHHDHATHFAAHPMGRSMFPVAAAPQPPAGPPQHNPFTALGSQFEVRRVGDTVVHRRVQPGPDGKPVAEQEWAIHHVIGSGTRGHSYLTNRNGFLFESPISWYSQKNVWDLSPTFNPGTPAGRAIPSDCLYCHANRANPVAGTINRYESPVFDGAAIGCQRCHGPGERHVARWEGQGAAGKGGDVDHTIVNPRHLDRGLREAVCEQCHLQGVARSPLHGRDFAEYRPGLQAHAFWSVFVRAPDVGDDQQKAVGQVEQMYQSRCFAGDGPNRLGCISCHDPHQRVQPAERVAYYRGRCMQCHEQKGCALPKPERLKRTADDSCIDCHMPRYGAADVPHTAATDHRIPRGGPAAADGPKGSFDGLPVVSFYRGRPGVSDTEDDRGRALAVVKLARGGEPAAVQTTRFVLRALEEAVRRDPGDLPAGEALGYALGLQSKHAEALAAFQAVLARAPDRELALGGAAWMAELLGQPQAAIDHWRRAVAVNPELPEYRRRLAQLLVKAEAWADARPECDAWVRLDPFNPDARAARVACLLGQGDKAAARAEFARLERLNPGNLRELQIRFEKKLR